MNKVMWLGLSILMLALAGCATPPPAGEGDGTYHSRSVVINSLITLRLKGCEAISPRAKVALLLVFKSTIPNYPDNGICNPDLVDKFYNELYDKLESQENAFYNGSENIRRETYSWSGQMGNRDGTGVLLPVS